MGLPAVLNLSLMSTQDSFLIFSTLQSYRYLEIAFLVLLITSKNKKVGDHLCKTKTIRRSNIVELLLQVGAVRSKVKQGWPEQSLSDRIEGALGYQDHLCIWLLIILLNCQPQTLLCCESLEIS